MKVYLKGFYGYKNFGDEILFLGVLNYIDRDLHPAEIVVECGDKARLSSWIGDNNMYLNSGILPKIKLVEHGGKWKKWRQFLTFLGIDTYRNYFKIFGGGEVLDESRDFPHDGRDLAILHHRSIRKKNFMLIGGIGSYNKKRSKLLFKFMLARAKKIVCREKFSYDRVKKYGLKTGLLFQDFSKEIFESGIDRGLKNQKNVLINASPRFLTNENMEKIKEFCRKYDDCKKIFFPADIGLDMKFFDTIKSEIPDLILYNWTEHSLQESMDLLQTCQAGIGSRLHFLYPLRIFGKKYESISKSDKVQKFLKS